MFQFGRFPTYTYVFSIRLSGIPLIEFPHSDTCGSMLICSSPQLFAAYRVLLRLPMPRHSPCTLYSLNFVRNANLFWRMVFLPFSIVVILPNFNHRLTCFCRFVSLLSRFAFFSPFCFIQFSRYIWWAQVGSNHRPLAYQASALACWAMSPSLSVSLAFWMPVLFSQLSLCGGDEEIRTLDPLLAGQVLSQLSYTPVAIS